MIKARRIGHAFFETPDLERLSDHYTGVVGLVLAGREKGRRYFASKLGHLTIELRQGSEAVCRKVSFEVAPATDLDAVARELEMHGIRSERSNDPAPTLSQGSCFQWRLQALSKKAPTSAAQM